MKIKEFAILNGIDTNIEEPEIIKAFLIKEYGHLIKMVKDISQVEFKEIDCRDLKYHENIIEQYNSLDLSNYKGVDVPIIVLKSNFHLVDGYHRLALALKEKKGIIPAYLIS